MGLPTLLKKGHLIPAMGEDINELNEIRPIDYILDWFRDRITSTPKSISDRIIIANSTTGSGKSTVIPTEIYLAFSDNIKNIIVTQPRVVTAVDIPKTIVKIPVYKNKLVLGKNIGFQTGEYVSKNKGKGILFCTIGILLQFLKNQEPAEFCNRYRLIVIDEAHDRSISLDLVFYFLKQLISKVSLKDYPFVIITSGTIDVPKYTSYFDTKTIFNIKGDSFPIKDVYLKYDTSDIMKSTIACIKDIQKVKPEDDKQDIVVFVPTGGMIRKLKTEIEKLNDELDDKLLPIGLDSTVFKEAKQDYEYAFKQLKHIPIPGLTRKVIIGTNAIETGITLESISHCIDTGLVNMLEYNPALGVSIMVVKPVTKDMSKQRRGRVGRIQEGTFHALYSESTYVKLQDMQYPELMKSELTQSVLGILVSIDDGRDLSRITPNTVETIDLFPSISFSSSLSKLYDYGMINSTGNVTEVGKLVNGVYMMSVECVRIILAGYVYGCDPLDLVTIASFITIGKQRIITSKFKHFDISTEIYEEDLDIRSINRLRMRLFVSCDFIEFLIFFYKFKQMMLDTGGDIEKMELFCSKNNVSLSGMLDVSLFRDDMIASMTDIGVNFHPSHDTLWDKFTRASAISSSMDEFVDIVIRIKKCIYEGFKLNVAKWDGDKYVCQRTGLRIHSDLAIMHALPDMLIADRSIDTRPTVIVYDNLIIHKDRTMPKFTCDIMNGACVMSGFVNVQ